jgi:hypothetical protein
MGVMKMVEPNIDQGPNAVPNENYTDLQSGADNHISGFVNQSIVILIRWKGKHDFLVVANELRL